MELITPLLLLCGMQFVLGGIFSAMAYYDFNTIVARGVDASREAKAFKICLLALITSPISPLVIGAGVIIMSGYGLWSVLSVFRGMVSACFRVFKYEYRG